MIIAGPYEFLADVSNSYGNSDASAPSSAPLPPIEEGRRAFAVHSLLRVDAGWLSPKAARWMKQSSGKIPPGYQVVNAEPVSSLVDTRIGKIGILLFPEGPVPGKAPTPAQEQSVLAAGRALQSQAALVVGVSPWGLVGEKNFLPKAQGIFDCILGGGEGVGFAQSLSEKSPDVLWLRPDGKGRAVNVVEILRVPERGTPKPVKPAKAASAWIDGVTFRASLEFLDNAFPPDPAMQKLVGNPAPGK